MEPILPDGARSALNPTRGELLRTFALDRPLVRGSGCYLYDDDGRDYLDVLSQYGALPFGHNPSEIWAAVRAAETAQTPAMLQPLRAVEAERLAERLAEVSPGDLSIATFANSGAETVEAAIKLARSRTGRRIILSTENGFHGKTLGALAATGNPIYQQGFHTPSDGFVRVPYGDVEALEARLAEGADEIAALVVEPIQGEGGVVVPPADYLARAIALCRRYGVLSIVDEIQTGLGRTGRLFACEATGETPDMLLVAKALGGGLVPIGACLVRPSVWNDRFGLLHSSTFANNNLACRVGTAVIDTLLAEDARLLASVAENGAYFRERLEALRTAYPGAIRGIRGRGYMLGVEFHRFDTRDDSAVMAFCSLNQGVTPLFSSYLFNVHRLVTAPLFNATHVMRLQPALTAGRAEIDRAVEALGALAERIERRDYHAIVRHLVEVERKAPPAPRRAKAAPVEAARSPHRFAFLIHYTEADEMIRLDPSFSAFDEDGRADWRAWMKRLGPGFVRHMPGLVSADGAPAEGWILSLPTLPAEMRGAARAESVGLIEEAVALAAEKGATRLGLGAFTSIVTRGGAAVTGKGLGITSGNTLTSVIAVRGLEAVAERVGRDLSRSHVAVVGATGAIGRLAALMLARRARRLTLVGNPANPFSARLLDGVADEATEAGMADAPVVGPVPAGRVLVDACRLRAGGAIDGALRRASEVPIVTCTTDMRAALAEADVVLVATSSEIALVDPADLAPGTIVCDVARPPNVARADLRGTGALVFDGGLVEPPVPVDLGATQTLPKGLCWGCLAETMLLAFEGDTADYSIGSKLDLAEADRIAALADKHGFRPAVPQWYGRLLDEGDFAEVVLRSTVENASLAAIRGATNAA